MQGVGYVNVELPNAYGAKMRDALQADPQNIRLRQRHCRHTIGRMGFTFQVCALLTASRQGCHMVAMAAKAPAAYGAIWQLPTQEPRLRPKRNGHHPPTPPPC